MCTSDLLLCSKQPRSSVALIPCVYIFCAQMPLVHHHVLLGLTSEAVGTTPEVSVTHLGRLLMLIDSVELPLSPVLPRKQL